MLNRNIAFSAVFAAAVTPALAQQAPDQARVDAVVATTFAGASAEWKARIALDETQKVCTATRNHVGNAQAKDITEREAKSVIYPADGKFLGDWKAGFTVANNGQGGQFSDAPGTVSGGNCYACHQMDPKEVSFGTLGPSLAGYGRERKNDAGAARAAWTKIFNSQAVVACSNMPRFGSNKVLTEQQIKDVMAYLLDPESPVNK